MYKLRYIIYIAVLWFSIICASGGYAVDKSLYMHESFIYDTFADTDPHDDTIKNEAGIPDIFRTDSIFCKSNDTAKEQPIPMPDTALRSAYTLQYAYRIGKGSRISAGISGTGYAGFLQLESPLEYPYFELGIKNFSLGIYPLAFIQHRYPNRNIPTLFAGIGSLSFGSIIRFLEKPIFTAISIESTIPQLSKKRFAYTKKTGNQVQYAVSLAGNTWETAFIAVPNKKHNGMQYGLFGSWQQKNIHNSEISLSLQNIMGFIPDTSQHAVATGSILPPFFKRKYHTLLGMRFWCIHAHMAFELSGVGSISSHKAIGGGGRAIWSTSFKHGGGQIGISAIHPHYVHWNGALQRERLHIFARPHITFGQWALYMLYAFELKEAAAETDTKLHTFGVNSTLQYPLVKWKTYWKYTRQVHIIKTSVAIKSSSRWFPKIQWFKALACSGLVRLEEIKKNPFLLKDYTIALKTAFGIADNIDCGFGLHLRHAFIPIKGSDTKGTYLRLQSSTPAIKALLFFRLKKLFFKHIHTLYLETGGKTKYPYFELALRYRINRK